ncbi:MAG: VWA domain-containing protein, partial [Terriglobales bacterium]
MTRTALSGMLRTGWLALAISCVAQVNPSTARAQDDPACLTRIVRVTVSDQKGQPVIDLTAERFRGKFRGQPVKILHSRFQAAPGQLVIVMDASGSMRDLLRGQKGWVMAGNAVAFAPASESLGLLIFSEGIKLRVELSSDRQAVMEKLNAYLGETGNAEGSGRTAVRDAVQAALVMLAPVRRGDTIYLISDGGDNRSKVEDKDLRRALIQSGVRLYALVPVGFFPATPEEKEGAPTIANWAKVTGGYARYWQLGPLST